MFTWLSVYPIAEGTDSRMKATKQVFSITAGLILIFALIFNTSFVIKYAKTDLASALHALYQVASETSVLYTFVAAYISRHRIVDVFNKYQQIFDSSKVECYYSYSFMTKIHLNF